MDGLAKWRNSDEWAEDGGRYIPHPATWLNGERWEDEVRPRRAGNGRGTVLAQNYDQRSYEGVQEAIMARQEAEMEAFLREN